MSSGARRPRCTPPRDVIVRVKFTAAEKATLDQAAGRAALSLAAYLGQAGMDAAEHRAAPVTEIQREALAELVRRAGVNLNQAVARLNATGQPGPDLGPAADYCMRVVGHVDQAAERVSRGLNRADRARPPGPGPQRSRGDSVTAAGGAAAGPGRSRNRPGRPVSLLGSVTSPARGPARR